MTNLRVRRYATTILKVRLHAMTNRADAVEADLQVRLNKTP